MLDLQKWITDDLMTCHHKMSYQAFEALAYLAHGKDTIIEIGAFAGTVTRLFTLFSPHVHTIDHFKGDWAAGTFDADGLYDLFKHNNAQALESGRLTAYPMTSNEAAPVLKAAGVTADMIWIDADHSYEAVKQDIENYLPLLRPNGVICGHDAGPFPGVTQAVNELLPDAFWFNHWVWTYTKENMLIDRKYQVDFEQVSIPGLVVKHADGEPGIIALASVAE